ncbi:MAG: ankyrin repeat domain-containing protein [Acidimicrobiia bacterium]|nr:ankyrin repeat domain-containing protein [Acidimicrobiia bacterium]
MEPNLVKEFVSAAHAKLERTEEMLKQQPSLLNATWDWGGGDFETGLGGASHMGNREIAQLLIGKGARMDIFAAAMLGRLEIVHGMCEAFPGIHTSLGPHGITLLTHARKGGEPALEVAKYLESLSK